MIWLRVLAPIEGEPINSDALTIVRFGAHSGLRSDIARGPESATERTRSCGRVRLRGRAHWVWRSNHLIERG